MIIRLPFPTSKNDLHDPAVNHKTGKAYMRPTDAYKAWKTHAGYALNLAKPGKIEGPFWATIRFTRPDDRHRDVQNLPEAVFDLLQAHKIITNDCECQGFSCEWMNGPYDCWIQIIPCLRRGVVE